MVRFCVAGTWPPDDRGGWRRGSLGRSAEEENEELESPGCRGSQIEVKRVLTPSRSNPGPARRWIMTQVSGLTSFRENNVTF